MKDLTPNSGERQVAPTIDGIRADHVARYKWADSVIPEDAHVLDIGCGVGYGSDLLARRSKRFVRGIDNSAEALEYAERHYKKAHYNIDDLSKANCLECFFDYCYATAFEVIEHLADPSFMLRAVPADNLLCSVPNEEHWPHTPDMALHHRHYTEAQFRDLLEQSGWAVVKMLHQEGMYSEVGTKPGRTLVARCVRKAATEQPEPMDTQEPYVSTTTKGAHVAILGLGPSVDAFTDHVKRLGGVSAYCDQVWTINALGDVFRSDLVFHMDDVRVQMARAEARPQSNIARMVDWLRTHPGPIMTSHVEPGFPGLVAYPLREVVKATGHAYFNSTVAYAVAYAIYKGVKRISIFGCDYSYANSHHAERGRACLEYWLAVAKERGIEIAMPATTALMDVIDGPDALFYGYDGYEVRQVPGGMDLSIEPRDLPDAETIEKRYDHSQPASAHVRKGLSE